MVQAMQIVKKAKRFSCDFRDDMIVCQWFLLEVQGYIRYRAGFSKGVSEMIRLGLNRKVDEAFKIQYLCLIVLI
jgi:4-hydroxy-tetrahydrodipicolinate synthase